MRFQIVFLNVFILFSYCFRISFRLVPAHSLGVFCVWTSCLVLLAEQVDEGDKRVREPHGLLALVSQVVCAQRDEDPHPVVQFVLAVHVKHELARPLRELQHPKQLLRPGEAGAFDVELRGVLRGGV